MVPAAAKTAAVEVSCTLIVPAAPVEAVLGLIVDGTRLQANAMANKLVSISSKKRRVLFTAISFRMAGACGE
jgi:hypothetical protein